MSTHNKEKKLLDQVRKIMRLRHYSIHTERAYCDWIKRYVSHHKMTCRDDLKSGEAKIEAFLTHLAVDKDISPSTQNQAMNALVFLYKQVLKQPLNDEINAVHAAKEVKLPVVMAREEVARVIALMEATTQLVVKLLYGSGLRITEAIRLRVKDIDYDVKQINVRSGKGAKDRVTTLSSSVNPQLENHLTRAKLIHENDLKDGYGEVYMPYALSRKYANAAKEWSWGIPGTPYLFPGAVFCQKKYVWCPHNLLCSHNLLHTSYGAYYIPWDFPAPFYVDMDDSSIPIGSSIGLKRELEEIL